MPTLVLQHLVSLLNLQRLLLWFAESVPGVCLQIGLFGLTDFAIFAVFTVGTTLIDDLGSGWRNLKKCCRCRLQFMKGSKYLLNEFIVRCSLIKRIMGIRYRLVDEGYKATMGS